MHPGSPELPHKIGNSFRNDLLLFVKEIINKRRKEKAILVEKNLVPELIIVATIATSDRGIFFPGGVIFSENYANFYLLPE